MTEEILNNARFANINPDKSAFLKDLERLNFSQFIELRQVNSGFESYSITSTLQDWSSVYYGITSFPYVLISLNEVYDNIIPGVNEFIVSTTAGASSYSDNYLLNVEYSKKVANIFSSSDTSISSSISSVFNSYNNFIDYEHGLVVFHYPVTSVNVSTYSSGIRIKENIFVCVANKNEFRNTSNPSAFTSTTSYISSYTVPYVHTIGIYDDDHNLLAIANLDRAIKLSNKIDTIFKIQLDM